MQSLSSKLIFRFAGITLLIQSRILFLCAASYMQQHKQPKPDTAFPQVELHNTEKG